MPRRVGWVEDAAARDAEDARLECLVGDELVRVRYFGLQDEDPASWLGDDFDALDYGLELDLASGATWSCIWRRAGEEEALLVYPGPLRPHEIAPDHDVAIADVTERWATRTGTRIEGARAAWRRHVWQDLVSGNPLSRNPLRRRLRWGAEQRSLLCRVALALEFDGGDGVVLTLGCRDESGLTYSGDDVAVLFSVDAARAAGVALTSED